MSAKLIANQVADDVIEITVDSPSAAQALARMLRETLNAEEVVAGLSSVCIRTRPEDLCPTLASLGRVSFVDATGEANLDSIEIEIKYGGAQGPDLGAVCKALNLSEAEFIAMHTERAHKVEMIGFTPGFAYISGLPDATSIPRLHDPRPRVPAGSVGISSAYTGIYALPGPGGWPLIGQTDAPLFSANTPSPFLLEPGRLIRFKAI